MTWSRWSRSCARVSNLSVRDIALRAYFSCLAAGTLSGARIVVLTWRARRMYADNDAALLSDWLTVDSVFLSVAMIA